MNVAVIGSRNIPLSFDRFCALMDGILPDETTSIVSGGARGTDSLAAQYARLHNLKIVEHRPDYSLFGKIAPLVRNRTIVDNSDFVVAIWDGASKGTLNTIDYTLERGIALAVYYFKKDEVRFFKPYERNEDN